VQDDCGGAYETNHFTLYKTPVFEDLTCGNCGCGEFLGDCPPPVIDIWNNNSECVGDPDLDWPLDEEGICLPFVNPPANGAIEIAELDPDGGCEPSGGLVAEAPEPAFAWGIQGCSDLPTSGECLANDVQGECVGQPAAPFEASVCIYQTGSHACPGTYPQQITVYAELNDLRDCSECQCYPSVDSVCEYYGMLMGEGGCQGGAGMEASSNDGCISIADLGFIPTGFAGASDANADFACDPEGGDPVGEVVGKSPTTICCSNF
jgi:hypothetical protein